MVGKTTILLEIWPHANISQVRSILESYGTTWKKAFPNVSFEEDVDLAKYYEVLVNKDLEEALKADLRAQRGVVEHVEGLLEMKAFKQRLLSKYVADDPMIERQWWLPNERVNKMHELLSSLKPKRKARVAVVDTGVDAQHEDLAPVWKGEARGGTDVQGHGTHVAGLVGAATNNMLGISSFNWDNRFMDITSFKGLGDSGSGTNETVAQAIIDAAEDGADVINLSLGGRGGSKVIDEAIQYAVTLGAIPVVAAGNDFADAADYSPANSPGVIVVSAHDQSNARANFSNSNKTLRMPIAAPGVSMLSTMPNGTYQNLDGTSMAAPVVAGVIGVMKSLDPTVDTEEAWKYLIETGETGPHEDQIGVSMIPYNAIKKFARDYGGGGGGKPHDPPSYPTPLPPGQPGVPKPLPTPDPDPDPGSEEMNSSQIFGLLAALLLIGLLVYLLFVRK